MPVPHRYMSNVEKIQEGTGKLQKNVYPGPNTIYLSTLLVYKYYNRTFYT